MQELTAAQKRL
jgi:hypothetical protein